MGGFGAGAAVFGPLAQTLIAAYGWRHTFIILGIVFSVVALPGSPEFSGYEFPFIGMLKTKQFQLMWVHYFLILCGGFAIVVHIKPLATEFGNFTPTAATGLVALVSAFNLGGRFLLGPLSDVIGRLRSFTVVGSLVTLAALAASFSVIWGMPNLLYFTAIMGGAAFGGYLALSPAFTADMWGMKSVGVNYGGMFTAWGVASFVGPFLAGQIYDLTGTYVWAFLAFAFMCLPALFIALGLVKPAALREHAEKIGLPLSAGFVKK